MKPIIVIPPKIMSERDIEVLKKNDLCVVVAKDPARVKFVDPIPAASSRNEIERAAILLSRILLNGQWGGQSSPCCRSDFARLYVECLTRGTELDPRGGRQEQEAQIYDYEWRTEVAKLARADAKAARQKRIEEEAARAKSSSETPSTPK